MIRSSSTPILGSLLSSSSSSAALNLFGESPSYAHPAVTCRFSPAPNGADQSPFLAGFCRTRSVDNLFSISDNADNHGSHHHSPLKCGAHRRSVGMPPLPVIGSAASQEEEEEEEAEKEKFSKNHSMLAKSTGSKPGSKSEPPLYLARGLGIDRLGSGLLNIGGSFFDVADGGDGSGAGNNGGCQVAIGPSGEKSDAELHYSRMVEEDPSNALFLRNYAQFLYQVKGDLRRAEEYYSRAVLSDQTDGDILAEYATLVWELHRDEERACCYFEQAARASPENSHVHAAYAAFLWNVEDGRGGEDEDGGGSYQQRDHRAGVPVIRGSLARAAAA